MGWDWLLGHRAMRVIRYFLGLYLLLGSVFLSACTDQHIPSDSGNQNSTNPLTLYFNKETGAQFVARTKANSDNPLPTSSTTFYNQQWHKNPIDVVIEHGPNTITLHHVISVQTATAGNNGIVNSYNNIGASLTNNNTMGHDQARLEILSIFKHLKQKGWQRVIELSSPRLVGKDTITYASKHTYELDPDYAYTLDEWMQLKDGSRWLLQANGIYVTITMRRDQSKMDPKKSGAYYISYEFVSEKEYYAPYFKDDDLKKWEINAARWVTLYPGIKKEMNQIRAEKEAELKAQGIMIDESYQDPPLVSKK
ncbi:MULTISPECIES: hypothetical protein [Acinetobacter]|uniref:Uncharacterized protein n=2 Tax=Acinetobacter TaxID=469 RepID=N9C539_9GAMM|nr:MULTISPECIES: hypothetical protein [Acinetobacter]ENV80967.1 hypothetical protein F942_00118 [Acinetobacter ursingii ANC 3649]MDI3238357.1 hypothetical protein [Acinetobacter ursingii]